MAFINGSFVIDAPASALNNSGEPISGARTENTSSVKFINTPEGRYPYASGQAVRYWLRRTLEGSSDLSWQAAPVYRGDKVAFSDANPIFYWDDDLLGYMRAPAKADHQNIQKQLEELGMTSQEVTKDKKNPVAVTRASPFRVGTLVSLAPTGVETDYGTMSRHEGDPVPYEHQFYRALLHSMFALDLRQAGRFYYQRRTGFRNLDEVRQAIAEQEGLAHDENEKSYLLSDNQRTERVASLLTALGRLQGGAKQAIHYTDVSPAAAIFAVVRGGSNPFNYIFHYDPKSKTPTFDPQAFVDNVSSLAQTGRLLSPVYIGWKSGFMSQTLNELADLQIDGVDIYINTPESAFVALAEDLKNNPEWLDA